MDGRAYSWFVRNNLLHWLEGNGHKQKRPLSVTGHKTFLADVLAKENPR
jgi:hypothetical protein